MLRLDASLIRAAIPQVSFPHASRPDWLSAILDNCLELLHTFGMGGTELRVEKKEPLYQDSWPRCHFLLVIEKKSIDAELIKVGLDEAGVDCELELACATMAVELLGSRGSVQQTRTPDLILLDLDLPDAGGYKVLEIVKSDPRLRVIPTIALTSSTESSEIYSVYASGANSVLQKPESSEELMDLVFTIAQYWLRFGLLPARC